MLAGQKSVGDYNIFLGFSATSELDGIIKLAKLVQSSVFFSVKVCGLFPGTKSASAEIMRSNSEPSIYTGIQ